MARALLDRSLWSRLALLWLAGLSLRITLLAIPPVLPLIERDLGLGATPTAVLTNLPVLLLSAAAVVGSISIARLGTRGTIVGGLLLVAVAGALRGAGSSAVVLFAMTLVMGVAIAAVQPVMPTLARDWHPQETGLATATYVNGLLVGEVLSASLTLPIVLPATGSWEISLAVWSVPVALTVLLLARKESWAREEDADRSSWWPDWRNPSIWRLGMLQGGASALYFASNTFIPTYLHAVGRVGLVGVSLAALNIAQLPASILLALWPRALGARRSALLGVAVFSLTGLGAFLNLSGVAAVAGVAAVGFCTSWVLIVTLALPPRLTDPGDVHRVSAGMFAIGYACAFVAPVLGGLAWDATASPASAFLPAALGALIIPVAGLPLLRR